MQQHSNRRIFLKSGISFAAAGGLGLVSYASAANHGDEEKNISHDNTLYLIG